MKKMLVLAFAVAAVSVPGAQANGSPYSPGLVQGWDGVAAPSGAVRYVTLGTPRSTVVAAISVRGGRVLRTRALRGLYGIPIVAYDGTTGGVSGDGRSLVVSSYGPLPGAAGTTRFVALRTKTLRPRRVVELRGSWSYDAVSPDGTMLFLVEHLSAPPNPRYRIRVFDLDRGRMLPQAIVDRIEKEAEMRGQPATRATSPDGRWAYTLYARANDQPFVHALDTQRRDAVCIDLPIRLDEGAQMGLRLVLRSGGELAVRNGAETVAVIDTRSLRARSG